MTSPTRGVLVVAVDTAIRGAIRNCRMVEVFGYVEGEIAADSVVVREGGRIFGKLRAEAAEVHGAVQGQAFVKNLMRIGSTGQVSGQIQYGQLAMDLGGELSAEVRNVPPAIFGDLEIAVARGGTVALTVADVTAVDPDSLAAELVYRVTGADGGFIEIAGAESTSVAAFTQADLEAGRVAFRHDGRAGAHARFDLVVTDGAGASSGTPSRVHVAVR